MPRLSSKAGQKASRGSQCLIDRHHPNVPQASRVFFISELLEMILLSLDMLTLLLSRRVCRTWDEAIRTSRKLQQALFYTPDTTIPAEQGRHNPLIIDKLWFKFPGAPVGMRDGMHLAVYEMYRDSLFMPRMPRKRGREEAYRRPEASWRRMLLRQPPTSRVFFWDPEISYRGWGDISGQVEAHATWTPGGGHIRMGSVAHWVDAGALSPGSVPFVFWANGAAAGVRKTRLLEPHRELEALRGHLSKYELAVITESDRGWEPWVPGKECTLRVMPAAFRRWFRAGDVTLLMGEPN